MRSEIFNKIRQNKIQHYAELNKTIKEVPAKRTTDVTEKESNRQVSEENSSGNLKKSEPSELSKKMKNNFEAGFQHLMAQKESIKKIDLKPVIVNIFPKIKLILNAMVQTAVWLWKVIKTGYIAFIQSAAMNYLREQVRSDSRKLKQMSVKINDRIERQSDKLAKGIYDASAGLFEDKEEISVENSNEYSGFAESASGENSIEWELEIHNQPTVTLNERLAVLSEKTAAWITRLPEKINTFFTSDKLPDLDGMTLSGMK
jgi:hypothetical protein